MIDSLLDLWRPVWSILTIFALWGFWSLKKLMASKDDLRTLEERVIQNEKILALLEEKHATKADLHKIALRVSSFKATQKAQSQQLNAISDSVRRIENYLLEKDK